MQIEKETVIPFEHTLCEGNREVIWDESGEMSRKKRRQRPEWKWEQALIDAYYDYRWRQMLNPL